MSCFNADHGDTSDDDEQEPEDIPAQTCIHEADTTPAAYDNSTWTMRNDVNPAPQLTVEPGLTTPPPADADIDYFVRLFLLYEVFDFLAAESNRYAAQYLATQTLGPRARAQAWKPATRSDMKRFIAIYSLSGIVQKSQLQQYWTHDVYLETPGFGRIMSRDRFLLLLQFLHFSNKEAATPGDRLAKLRPLTDMMFGLFERLDTPHQFISIDEELVLFKERLLFKQYIPSKCARFGLKIFALCDTHGYFYTASVYTGQPNPPLPHTDTLGATGAIVVHLMENLLDKGYHLYVDNWYTSINLASFLESRGTGLCGTMRANRRGIPQALKESNCPKGTYAYRRKGSLQLVKVHDKKKVIYLLSTIHDAGLVRTNKRNRQGQVIKRLRVNHEYNSRLGGVDKNDAMVTSVSALRKTMKWYIKVGMHFFEEALQNAYVTYRQQGGREQHYHFVSKAVHVLVSEAEEAGQPTPHQTSQDRLVGKHLLQKNPPTAKRQNARRKCVVCTSRGLRRESRYQCKTCHDHPGLCVDPCNEIYHTVRKY